MSQFIKSWQVINLYNFKVYGEFDNEYEAEELFNRLQREFEFEPHIELAIVYPDGDIAN